MTEEGYVEYVFPDPFEPGSFEKPHRGQCENKESHSHHYYEGLTPHGNKHWYVCNGYAARIEKDEDEGTMQSGEVSSEGQDPPLP